MQTIVLSCLFGAASAMVLWIAGSTAAMHDQMMRRGGSLSRPEER